VPHGTGFAFRENKSCKDFPGISSIHPVFQFLLAFVEILIQGKHIILKFFNHEIII